MLRQKVYETGSFCEIEIFRVSDRCKKFKRKTKIQESTPAQKKLNDKKSQRNFVRKVHLNFTQEDLYIDLTYDKENIPTTREEVMKDIKNYVSRLKRARKRLGITEPLKYIYVISNMDNNGNKVRYHVHMIINSMDRDVAEQIWGKGRANTDRLQYNEYGVEGKSLYMARQAGGERAWGGSTNLKKVEAVVKDNRRELTKKKLEDMERCPEDRMIFEKLYPGWVFTECIIERENEEGAGQLRFLIKMRKYKDSFKTS
ncbi:hypothetical protein AALA22_10760 [Anaerovoracaceae bacterium 41-7]|uniref:rolling circle replication-associated protein n=1 Tax=Emergencia sp. JLR.KK010 TaxID=3114296 RepID=UPI0030CFBD27